MKLAVPRGARRLLLAAALCLSAVPAGATSYVMLEDGPLVEDSSLVVEARVLSADPAPATRLPAQDYMIEIDKVLAGDTPGRNLVVRVPGGRSASGLTWEVEGVPRFTAGERVLLFLSPRPDGTYGVRHLMLGAFHEVVAGGERLFVRDLREARELGGTSGDRALYRQARKADAFSRWVSDRARGHEREPDYFVAEAEADVVASVTAAYRLFDNSRTGNNIRWFEFDKGDPVTCNVRPPVTIPRDRPVDFFIVRGGQPGYSEGDTANAMRTAISAWNGISGTTIRYRYAGTTASSEGFENCPEGRSGGVCLDGKNALLYADGDGSIGSPFSCTGGGGTLAIGGPVYQDACSIPGPQGKSFHPSVEAEIITNKNIECIVKTARDLEELLGHELGHTLGIHHPCESNPCGTPLEKEALMYPTFHGDGRGAQPNSDDMAAARYLYPGTTSGATPPAAPSGLAAVPLSPTSVQLTWTDNSTNETSFRIDAKQQGAASFATVGSTGANATSFVATGLTPATTYTFRVQARNSAGGSAFVEVTVATAPDVPAAPANLVAAPDSSSSIGLTWDDLSTNETGFRIELRSPITGAWVEVAVVPAGTETLSLPGLISDRPYTFRVIAVNGAGASAPSNEASATPPPADTSICEDTDTTVCLLDRFRVTISWNNPHGGGGNGVGHTSKFAGSDRTASAWFFSPSNVELIVKVLDGSALNEFFWVFHGQLTDVEFWITVLDTETGFSKTYHNPPFDGCGEFDTAAIPAEEILFEGLSATGAPFTGASAPAIDPTTGACVPDDETLCLLGGRFAVEVDWTNQHAGGTTGRGKTLPDATTDRTGFFWFFNPTNVELVVKVLQAGDTYWVFYGSLSDVEYMLKVTDTELGRTRTYHNAPGETCGQFDTSAFPPEG